jgi:hypothetical protein
MKKAKKASKPKTEREKRAAEYRDALEQLGLTSAAKYTAQVLGIKNVRRSQRFARAETDIPDSVMLLLDMYIKHGDLPPNAQDES